MGSMLELVASYQHTIRETRKKIKELGDPDDLPQKALKKVLKDGLSDCKAILNEINKDYFKEKLPEIVLMAANLTPLEKKVFILRYYTGFAMTYPEIALKLKIAPGTAGNCYENAVQKILKTLFYYNEAKTYNLSEVDAWLYVLLSKQERQFFLGKINLPQNNAYVIKKRIEAKKERVLAFYKTNEN